MDEAPIASDEKPIISPELADEIAQLLGVDDPDAHKHLAQRLQRYSAAYFFDLRRNQIVPTEGAAKKAFRDVEARIAALEELIVPLQTSEALRLGYKQIARHTNLKERPSWEGLRRELIAMREIAGAIANSPDLKRGPKGRPILRHAVGALMALFEGITGRRAETTTSQNSVKGIYLKGPEGRAIGRLFETIDPRVSEATLANLVDKLRQEFDGKPMLEGKFHLISAIEDTGEIILRPVQE